MTRVDFYVLEAGTPQARDVFACRLAEKAYGQGLGIYIHTGGVAETARLDTLLWTFRDGSFLPHLTTEAAGSEDPDGTTPILVGHGPEPAGRPGLLINLEAGVPTFFSRFERVAEIVGGDADARESARERFRFYRDRGYALDTHQIGSAHGR